MKISKIIKIFLCAAAVVLLFSGCDSNRENLKDLSVVEGIGIDYSNDIVSVTVQSLNLAKEGSGAEALSGNITMNTRGEGRNISAAVENVSERLSKKPFFGQNRIIVFGIDFEKENLNSS
ncbi:MAG: hypothetical protein LUG21_08805, partial [Clostridiales bacterium]|nr:hypothetical protein [Clostridiales bacterium]